MAKRCDCHGIVETLERDPRLRALPLAPRMLWFMLVRAMQAMGVSGLRFGSAVPKPAEIAMLVGIAESELETQLEPILARGLLERDADGALVSPLLKAMLHRAETSRANGLKGGRPRKPTAAPPDPQGSLKLPIVGGAVDVETQREPAAGVGGLSAKLSSKAEEAKQAVDEDEYHRVGRAALEAAGFDPARSMATYGIVRQWLADGVPEGVILEVVRAKARPGIKHLGYFTQAIQEAAARGPQQDGLSAKSLAFTRATEEWMAFGRQGPQPAPDWFAVDGSRRVA